MNNDAANALAESFLRGAFDVLDAMLSVSFSHRPRDIREIAPDELVDILGQHPVCMRASVKSGGPLALLFQTGDASRFASMVLGEAPIMKAQLDDNDLSTLREVAEPCIGSGVTNLMEKYGHGVEAPEQVGVSVLEPNQAQDLLGFLGAQLTAVAFDFSAEPDLNSDAVLLLSESMQGVMLAAPAQSPPPPPPRPAAPPEPTLSEDELGDILSAFGSSGSALASEASGPAPVRGKPAPPNLDMVLDIRLVATARLGRIEMPIGDILALGPGSIIPVGRLVDEPVELLVNEKLVARGDVVVVDERFGLRITEIVSAKERIESLH